VLARFGGILIRPRATIAALRAAPAEVGKWDGWLLVGLFVLGGQVERLVESVERFRVFRSVLLLFNGLAMALLIPVLVWLVIEGLVGPARARFRHLPLAPLVLCATLGNLLRQAGIVWPGPVYLPEMLGGLWGVALAVWIRVHIPVEPATDPSGEPAAEGSES
jgi:hypothetical protein